MTKKFNLALITGATSGIGWALAKLLALKGIPLLLTGRNQLKLEELKRLLESDTRVEIASADLMSRGDREKIISLIRERQVDLMINNAGFGLNGPVTSKDSQALLDMIELDVAAVVELTVEAAKSLERSNRTGVIMNISSAAAFHILPNMAVYSAAKAFVNSFSQTTDFELKKKGIRVLAACPGRVATQFQARASEGKEKAREGGLFMSSEFAAQEIWRQILNEKAVHIFDWRYRLSTFISHFIPKAWAVKIGESFIKRNHKEE